MQKYITKNFEETQKLGEDFAKEILRQAQDKTSTTAVVLVLQGDLGGGKTTFLQGFAKGLGIKEKVLSPTYIIYRKFKIKNNKYFYHFDCYRINKPEEILELGWNDIISDPNNIVTVEWPEKTKKYIPKTAIKIKFKFIDNNTREIMLR